MNRLDNLKLAKLYIKCFYYDAVEKSFGRNNDFKVEIDHAAKPQPGTRYFRASQNAAGVYFEIPETFFEMNEYEQCNTLAHRIALEHRIQKNV